MATGDLGIEERLRRKMGRPARTQSVATRFTEAEELELERAAEREGKTVREWTREALLREARRPDHDPIFTEVVATRVFLNNAIKALLLGETWTAEQFQQLTDVVRKGKREAARGVMEQYLPPSS
jgi:hypothetical protein